MTDFTRDSQFFEYAQLATAFAMTKAMHECGLDPDVIVDVNWVAHSEWKTLLDEYEATVGETPENTRKELASLLYSDLVAALKILSDEVNKELDDQINDGE